MQKDEIRDQLVELIFASLCRHIHKSCKLAENIADDLIAGGVTIAETKWCGYCAVALEHGNAYYPVKRTAMDRWTLMGKKLKFCPMCGRKLPEPPKEVE